MSVIAQCFSIEQVVKAINEANNSGGVGYFGGTDTRSGEEMAAEYAVEANRENPPDDDEFIEMSLEAHLDALIESGAEFDYVTAFAKAKKIAFEK